jgi:hypothetical protein
LRKTGEITIAGCDIEIGDHIKISNGKDEFVATVSAVQCNQGPGGLTSVVTIEELPAHFDSNSLVTPLGAPFQPNPLRPNWIQDPDQMPDAFEERALDEQKHPMKRAKGDWKVT